MEWTYIDEYDVLEGDQMLVGETWCDIIKQRSGALMVTRGGGEAKYVTFFQGLGCKCRRLVETKSAFLRIENMGDTAATISLDGPMPGQSLKPGQTAEYSYYNGITQVMIIPE